MMRSNEYIQEGIAKALAFCSFIFLGSRDLDFVKKLILAKWQRRKESDKDIMEPSIFILQSREVTL